MNDEISRLYSNNDLSPLSRVTVVIPTHNRNFYLSRCLWYHVHFPFSEIIIADSSSQEKREINKKTIDEISKLYSTKITYLEYDYPAEEYGGDIYKKWGDAIHHITTEYSLSCTDKEFLIPTTIVSSLQFLDKHSDYSLADGKYYMMNSNKEILQWQDGESISENSPHDRLKQLLKCVISTQFALHRTSEYKESFETLYKYNLFDIRFGETLIETFPILKGKFYKNKDDVMSIRDTTEFHKQHNIINYITNNLEKTKAESSFIRYRSYDDYPIERQNYLLNKYKDCIEKTTNISEDISYYSEIMKIRYTSTIKNGLFTFFWNYLIPYKLKYILSHLFGLGKMDKRIKINTVSLKTIYIYF